MLIHIAVRPDIGVQVMRDGRSAGQSQAGDHRQNGGEGHGGDETEQQVATHCRCQIDRRHVLAALDAADRGRISEFGMTGQQHDGAKAHQEGQDVEVADPASGVKYGLAGFDGIADGKETHQDMW